MIDPKTRGGISMLLLGPPGTGKSWFLGSCKEAGIENPLLLAPKPREVNSYLYRKHKIPFEVFDDPGWAPPVGQFEAGAFTRLYKRIQELKSDTTHDAVILDPFTDVTYLALHEILSTEEAETPREMRDSQSVYGSLKHRMKNFTASLVGLSSPSLPRPKHVFVAVHAQPTKEDQQLSMKQGGGTKESSDNRAKNVSFMGEVLPMVEGSYRQEMMGEFDIVGFTHVKHDLVREGAKMVKKMRYVVQLDADNERHAKAALLPRGTGAEIDNNMKALFDLIEEADLA